MGISHKLPYLVAEGDTEGLSSSGQVIVSPLRMLVQVLVRPLRDQPQTTETKKKEEAQKASA